MMNTKLHKEYDKDFYAWTMHNAQLLRQGKLSEIDIENVAEEIESMGKSDKWQLINRLAVLIAHLLKWQCQPERRGNSWLAIIKEQRLRVKRLLGESPSLKHELSLKLADAYELAVLKAMKETNLPEKSFVKDCPFTLDQCLRDNFFPKNKE